MFTHVPICNAICPPAQPLPVSPYLIPSSLFPLCRFSRSPLICFPPNSLFRISNEDRRATRVYSMHGDGGAASQRGGARRVGAPAPTRRFSRSGCPLPSPPLPIPCHFQSLACPAHAGSRAVDAAALWPPARNHRWANLHVRGLHRPRQSMTYFANFSAW